MGATLRHDTVRVIGQASVLVDFVRPDQVDRYAYRDIEDFLNAKSQDFEDKMDNICEFSPTLDHPFENIDAENTSRAENVQFLGLMYTGYQTALKIRGLCSEVWHGNWNARVHRSAQIKESLRPRLASITSFSPSDASRHSSVFSNKLSQDSERPLTDTNTSQSWSQRQKSHRRCLIPNLTGALSGNKECKDMVSNPQKALWVSIKSHLYQVVLTYITVNLLFL